MDPETAQQGLRIGAAVLLGVGLVVLVVVAALLVRAARKRLVGTPGKLRRAERGEALDAWEESARRVVVPPDEPSGA